MREESKDNQYKWRRKKKLRWRQKIEIRHIIRWQRKLTMKLSRLSRIVSIVAYIKLIRKLLGFDIEFRAKNVLEKIHFLSNFKVEKKWDVFLSFRSIVLLLERKKKKFNQNNEKKKLRTKNLEIERLGSSRSRWDSKKKKIQSEIYSDQQ